MKEAYRGRVNVENSDEYLSLNSKSLEYSKGAFYYAILKKTSVEDNEESTKIEVKNLNKMEDIQFDSNQNLGASYDKIKIIDCCPQNTIPDSISTTNDTDIDGGNRIADNTDEGQMLFNINQPLHPQSIGDENMACGVNTQVIFVD